MIDAHYDPDVDALAINWGDAPIEESNEIAPGLILDYDSGGNVIGVEILDASKQVKQLPGKPLLITPLDKIPQ